MILPEVSGAVLEHLPARIVVSQIVSSRYPNHVRPKSWDERGEGIDVVRSDEGKLIRLFSDGGQTPPWPGSTIVIMRGDSLGYRWTLYGLPPAR